MTSRDYYNLIAIWEMNHYNYQNEELEKAINKQIDELDQVLYRYFAISIRDFETGTDRLVFQSDFPDKETIIKLRELGIREIVNAYDGSGWIKRAKELEEAGYKPTKIIKIRQNLGGPDHYRELEGLLFVKAE